MHIIPGGTLIAETVTAPLYPDARVSTDACQIMLRSYICRHHPSKQAQSDLLGLLQILLPLCSTTLLKSLYLFDSHH